VLRYAGGGSATIETVTKGANTGIRLTFVDEGPGIDDIAKAMKDGFTTGGSLGLGLPGAKRLSDEFSITSEPGVGTTVVITKWRNAF
jgi:serine/threonine-protein kinase RsbT